MGYIRRPSYYKNFRCIGSVCTDNCCIGWEIDIDEDTLAFYRAQTGTIGGHARLLPNGFRFFWRKTPREHFRSLTADRNRAFFHGQAKPLSAARCL